jgi:hypothetical protein
VERTNNEVVAVPWGNYRSYITGGTGKFANATGYLDNFGMADFTHNTLVLRYRGPVCYAFVSGAGEIVPGFFLHAPVFGMKTVD